MRILLVEPYYNRKYPPLGLMKISTWHKKHDDIVKYVRAKSHIDIDFKPNLIYVTSLFTWDLPIVVNTINAFKHRFPKSKIMIGGVAVSAMPEYIENRTGIKPYIGILSKVDGCMPDYSLFPDLKESMVFTTRGCPHKCSYCVVRIIEPDYYEIKGWERAIDPTKPQIVVFDNNILTSLQKHVDHVFDVLEQTNKWFDINSGFDVFLFTKEHAERISQLKIKPIRLAFDKMSQEKAFMRSIKYCEQAGIKLDRIRVYVLYNWKDSIEEAKYRANKVIELGCKPFVMRYKPLDWLKKEDYISELWTERDIRDFTQYYNMPVVWNKMTYDEFKDERNDFSRLRKELKIENINQNKKLF